MQPVVAPATAPVARLGDDGRPVVTADVLAALRECQDRGWVETREDDFRRPTWHATPAGIERSKQP